MNDPGSTRPFVIPEAEERPAMVSKSIVRLATSFGALAIAACGTARPGLSGGDALRVLRECPIACEGTMGVARPSLEPAPPAADDPAGAFAASVRIGTVDADRCSALLPESFVGCAIVVASEPLESALAAVGDLPTARAFRAPDGEARSVSIATETSFIEGFRFESFDRAFIADPQVGLYQTGFRLVVEPRRAGAGWGVAVTATSIDASPGLEAEGELLAGADEVRFDVPVFATMVAETSALLGPGESLVLVAPPPLHADRVLVAIVTPQPPAAAQAP